MERQALLSAPRNSVAAKIGVIGALNAWGLGMLTGRTQRDETGASAVEYGLIVSAIAAVVTIIVFAFGGAVQDLFSESCTTIASEAAPTADCTP